MLTSRAFAIFFSVSSRGFTFSPCSILIIVLLAISASFASRSCESPFPSGEEGCCQRNLWLEPALGEPRRARRASVPIPFRASRGRIGRAKIGKFNLGARGRTRTGMRFPSRHFKCRVYTISPPGRAKNIRHFCPPVHRQRFVFLPNAVTAASISPVSNRTVGGGVVMPSTL